MSKNKMKKPLAFDVPMYVTRPSLPPLDKVCSHLEDIWQSRVLTNHGPKYHELESKLESLLRCSHIKLFCNGTLGLTLALQALEIQGEVITTPFTFPATPHAVSWAGATPVFGDIDSSTLCLTPASVESLIGPKTEAILGVHVYGVPCDVIGLQQVADKHGLKVIYDAAHAFMTEIDGVPISSFGDATMFSFHATKLYHSIEGGAIAFNDSNVGEQLELLRNFGIENECMISALGTNAKMNEVQSAIGIEMISEAILERSRRKEVRRQYIESLSNIDGVSCVLPQENIKDSLQYMVIRVDSEIFGMNADGLCEKLKGFNVFTRRYFNPLCTDYPFYKECKKSTLNSAERAASEVLSLPFYGELTCNDVIRVTGMINYIRNHRDICSNILT